jgi:hypothetical protein
MIRLRSKCSALPSQTKRSTRFPSSGTSRISPVSGANMFASEHSRSSGKNGSAGGAVLRQVQYRYTPGFRGKSGCSAMPSSPRSEFLFTPRSRTVPATTPSTTRCTLPVSFSITSMSFCARNARPIGRSNPEATVRTRRFGSSICGAAPWARAPSWTTSATATGPVTQHIRFNKTRRRLISTSPSSSGRAISIPAHAIERARESPRDCCVEVTGRAVAAGKWLTTGVTARPALPRVRAPGSDVCL